MAVNTPSNLDTELLITTWETEVRMRSLPADVFDFNSSEAVYSTERDQVTIPNDIYINLKAPITGSREVVCPIVLPLEGDPTLGVTGDQRTREEKIRTRHARFYYNDVSHAVSGQSYGMLAIDKLPYELYEKIGPLLTVYFKEQYGLHRRQALLERFGENIYADTHNVTPEINTNVYVAGLTNAQQPVYTGAAASWANAVGAALVAAGTGTNATARIRYLQRLEEWSATEKFIEPLTVEGNERYVFLCPSNQATWLKDAQNVGQLGNAFTEYSGLTEYEKMNFPGILGRVGRIYIVEDNRYPTLTIGGSAGGYTLTAGYFRMGLNDQRDKTATGRDVGFLLGRGALCEWKAEDLHYEYERENYDKIYGKGLFGSWGIQRVEYDTSENPDATTRTQYGSIVCIFAKPPAIV